MVEALSLRFSSVHGYGADRVPCFQTVFTEMSTQKPDTLLLHGLENSDGRAIILSQSRLEIFENKKLLVFIFLFFITFTCRCSGMVYHVLEYLYNHISYEKELGPFSLSDLDLEKFKLFFR